VPKIWKTQVRNVVLLMFLQVRAARGSVSAVQTVKISFHPLVLLAALCCHWFPVCKPNDPLPPSLSKMAFSRCTVEDRWCSV